MQTITADSSSLIYLSKTGLLPLFAQVVHLAISHHVYRECTRPPWPDDARHIHHLVESGIMTVYEIPSAYHLPLPRLGAGERSTIELWYFLKADSVMIDDRKGICLCRQREIPFLCAILVPGILKQNLILRDQKEVDLCIEKICQVGRYAQWIIDYAKREALCPRSEE
ncbi:MAG: hypothetical protein ACMUIA_08790 [bacterium]